MSSTTDRLLPNLVAAECSTAAVVFEAAVMYLYVTARRTRVGGPVTLGFETTGGRRDPVPEPLVCFDTAAPAARFHDALATRLGDSVWIDVRTSGIRHRFQVHGVCTYDEARPGVISMLADAWRQGNRLLVDPAVSPSSDRSRRRREYAAAAWRALLLAGTPVRRSDELCVRVPNTEFAAIMVRAARLLQLAVTTGRDVRNPTIRVADHTSIRRVLAPEAAAVDPRPPLRRAPLRAAS